MEIVEGNQSDEVCKLCALLEVHKDIETLPNEVALFVDNALLGCPEAVRKEFEMVGWRTRGLQLLIKLLIEDMDEYQ